MLRAARGGNAAPSPKPSPLLTPVFVRMTSGRVGSTLLMQLLGTSEQIAFERKAPFEKREAAGLLAWAHSLREPLPEPGADWATDDYLWWIDPKAYGVWVTGDPLHRGPKGPARDRMRRRALRGIWRALSATERELWPQARWYAEKYGGFAEDLLDAGIPVRFIDLIRDPRDIWASIRSFDAQRGYYGFGRRADQSEDEYLRAFATALARRIAELDGPDGAQRLLVRYEDLATDLPGQAARIAAWLGVTLDADAVTAARGSFRKHMTSPDLASSVGRWREDVSAEQQAVLARILGPLDRFGYTS